MTAPIPTPAPANRPAQSSTFARIALLVYSLLILYASWYPFTGWQNKGLSPFAYLTAPLPHYWTVFDVLTNVLAYIPFGILLVFALFPVVRGALAVLLAVLATVLWSGTMEAVQTYLPTRVSSNLDLMTNVGGALLGGLIGVRFCNFFLHRSRLLRLRRRWFSTIASRGLIVVGTWPLAQIYPQGTLFGHGQLLPILSDWFNDLLGTAIDPVALIWTDLQLSAEQFRLSEILITASGMCGAVLTLLCLLHPRAPAVRLMLVLTAMALGVKTMSTALLFGPENAFAWLTPGARGGLLLGAALLIGLRLTPTWVQRRLAVAMLLVSLVAVNLIPSNPYFIATLQRWVQGKFLSFNGATQFMSMLWPFLALWFLLHAVHRRRTAHV